MTESIDRADPRVADFVRAGEVRAALFLPQFVEDPKTGALRGLGTGYAATLVMPELAKRLGVASKIIGYPTPASVVDCIRTGECDFAFLGIEPTRAAVLDFGPALFEFDYTFLVPAGSSIDAITDADRPGARIALIDNHASALALRKIIRHATLVGSHLPDEAFGILRAGGADALACPRDVLMDYAEKLPGSRVLADAFGVNRVGMATAKGHPGRVAYMGEFARAVKAMDLLPRAIADGHLRGFRVAREG